MVSENNDYYQSALMHYNAGRLDEAEHELNRLISVNAPNYDVYNFLGVILLRKGQYNKAAEYLSQVLAVYPEHPEVNYHYGYSLQCTGDYNGAAAAYLITLKYIPDNFDALNNLALVYLALNNYEEAEKYFLSALRVSPSNPKVFNNIGNLYYQMEEFLKAGEYYELASSEDPGNIDYKLNYALSCYRGGNYQKAVNIYLSILRKDKFNKKVLGNLTSLYITAGDYEKAREYIYTILHFDPRNHTALYNLAITFDFEGKYDDALRQYENLSYISEDKASAQLNCAAICLIKNDLHAAEEIMDNLYESKDEALVNLTNLALVSMREAQYYKAKKLFEYILTQNIDLPEIHYNYSHLLFLEGDLIPALSEYEWRKKRPDFIKRNYNKPELVDQNIKNKRVLIYDEQGIGDIVQFIRYAKLLKKQEAHTILHCAYGVVELVKNVDGIDEVISREGSEAPEVYYDYQIALMSLPYYFKTRLESIPSEKKYMSADENKVKVWKERIEEYPGLKVGLVWAGNPGHTNDKNRSMKLEQLKEILELPGINIFALQKGAGIEQAKKFSDLNLHILDPYIHNLSDTAAIIENMDLVISVDTSVAHIAGAIGKPVWVLLPYSPDWRWMLKREDTPWYPTMKLFRQQSRGDWQTVVTNLKEELKRMSGCSHEKEMKKSSPEILSENSLFLALTKMNYYGWGICSKYLRQELEKKTVYIDITEENEIQYRSVSGKVFHAINDLNFHTYLKVRGNENIGYTFFEMEPNENTIKNSRNFDLILSGSTWCSEKLNSYGIHNVNTLIQGIDPNLFFPVPRKDDQNLFVIFSGGKFEFRKGQDLLLKAFQVLHKKYPDIILINAWYNLWPHLISSMSFSKFIKYEAVGNTWDEFISHILEINDIDKSRVISLPITPLTKLRELYYKTDLGVFPNRGEGGTNLVLMEYMACGKPVIASYSTGHKDILNDENSILLKNIKPYVIESGNKKIVDWEEPDLEELIYSIEYAYFNRNKLRQIGNIAGEQMKMFTWERTADNLLKYLNVKSIS